VYVRAYVRSLSQAFSRFRPCILFQAFCLSLSFPFTHTLVHAQSYALSHPLTYKSRHAPNRYSNLSRSLTQISLSSCLFLSLSLSYTRTLIHTHICTHTLSHLFTRSTTHSLLSRVRAALSSARALSSLFLSPLLPFAFFSFAILSLLLSSSPLARLLPRRFSLTRSLPLFFNSW